VSLRPGLRKNNLAFDADCQPGLVMNSYPGPFGQVLTNLLLNAVMHAFPDGKGGRIGISLRAQGNANVEVLVSDDGCGMSLDVLRQAFNPFFTTRRNHGSTGLGLHIVHTIVTNRLGGSLSLDSEPGEGVRLAPAQNEKAARQLGQPFLSRENSSNGDQTVKTFWRNLMSRKRGVSRNIL